MTRRIPLQAGLAGVLSLSLAAALWAFGPEPQQNPRTQGGAPAPKRLLVVSVTAGFRHASIEVGQKVLRELAERSGEFVLEFASVNPRDPTYALAPGEPTSANDRGGLPAFGSGTFLAAPFLGQADKDGDHKATKGELVALADTWYDKLDPAKTGKVDQDAFTTRLAGVLPALCGRPGRAGGNGDAPKPKRRRSAPAINPAAFVGPGLFAAADADKDGLLTREELRSAFGRWASAWDTDHSGLIDEAEARRGLNTTLPPHRITGFERNPKADAAGRKLLAEKMSPEALKHYDGVIFLNTTGDLPIPDLEAFYRWVDEGHAFIGMHAAADTLHNSPGYARMLGGEFASHGAQVEVEVLNVDSAHPATAALGKSLTVYEEMYLFKNYDSSAVHLLLSMEEHPNTEEPGHYPVSWTRQHGKGRVFYTSLGHREDVWDPAWVDANGKRENPPAVAQAYQKHILGGIRWALGLADQATDRRSAGQPANRSGRRSAANTSNPLGFDGPKTLAELMIAQGDKNEDHRLSKEEMQALADDWFARMDSEKAGALGSDRFGPKFAELLPAEQQGFGPPLLLAPGLFAASDIDKDGSLTLAELRETFGRWADRWSHPAGSALDEETLREGFKTAWPQPRFRPRGGSNRLEGETAKGADFSERPPIKPSSAQEEAKRFLLPEGYRMELVLADPTIEEPVAITFDGNGRMYVAEMRTYMQNIDGKDEREPISRVSRHEDTDGDGVYDRHTVFIDKLILPRFVSPWEGDSLLAMETDADEVYKYTDTDGDGVADKKELFFRGAGRRGNLEHQQSGMVWGLDNRLYTTYNAFRLRWTPSGVIKEPTAPNGGQWGLAQDDDGKMWFVDGGGERGPVNFQAPIVYGAFTVPGQFEDGFEVTWPAPPGLGDAQGGMARLRPKEQTLNHFTAACGQDVFRGHRLPDDLRGDLLFAEPVGRLVRRAKIVTKDGLTQLQNAYPKSEFIRSTDPLFRPVNMTTAPDGTLYIVDMYRGIIQEGTWVEEGSYLRRKVQQYGLDKVIRHGRIWRLTYRGMAPDRTRPQMNGETPAQLLSHLEHPNGWWRDTAQRLLVIRQDKSVVPALREMARSSSSLVGRFHSLWTLEGLSGALDANLVRQAMQSPEPRLRVQAIRLSETLYKAGETSLASDIRSLARDSEPTVAIQALLTLNLLGVPDAPALIRAAVDASRSRGVREIGGQALQPQGGGREFSAFRYTPAQRKLLERGSAIYRELCYSCHGADGRGAPLAGAGEGVTMAPPLAGSPRVQGHRDFATNVLLHGLIGPIDGKTYPSLMAPMGTNDDEWVASAASYVRNAFGNSASVVTAEEVASARAAAGTRSYPWTVAELESTLPGFLRYRSDWKVTASHNSEHAGFAINSPGFVRWDSDAPQEPGMWFQVELPRAVTLGELQLDTTGGFGLETYPRGFKVQVSPDGRAWSDPVAEGKGTGPSTRIALKPVPTRMIRVTLTEPAKDQASWTIQKMRLFEAVAPSEAGSRPARIGKLATVEVLDSVASTHGEVRRGAQLFGDLSCVACHTVRPDEPPKGPFLGGVSKTYPRRDLAEQILSPSKAISKGYDSYLFALKDGRQLEGFVVRETPDSVTIRTSAAQEQTLATEEVDERTRSPKSIMPEGLVANLTVEDLASLLDYLETLPPAPAPAPVQDVGK